VDAALKIQGHGLEVWRRRARHLLFCAGIIQHVMLMTMHQGHSDFMQHYSLGH